MQLDLFGPPENDPGFELIMRFGRHRGEPVLPGKAPAAALAVLFRAGCAKDTVVTLPADTRRRFGLTSRTTFKRALRALQSAGLVRVEGRPGARSSITILDVPRGETP
jgi:hypothetical protein